MSTSAGIYARKSPALEGYVQIGVAGERVLAVSFPDTPPEDAGTDHPLLDRIESYLEGAEDAFEDVTVALTLPTDQRAVLETLRDVSYGSSVTVEVLARSTAGLDHDDEADRRTVRDALGENPAPILIPDHRVRDASGATPPEIRDRLQSIEGL